jgi:hypothetical protein
LTQFTASSGFGTSIACDAIGGTIAVSAPTGGSGNVIIFNRVIENQYSTGSFVTPVNPFRTITSVTVNGMPVPASSNISIANPSTVTFQGFCFNVEQVIAAPNTTDKGFGTSLAIQNNQLVVGSIDTPIGSQYNKGVAYFYALDTSLTSTKIIPLSDLIFSTTPFMINNWIVTPNSANVAGLTNSINATTGYTGVSAFVSNANLILSINPTLQTSGIGSLGA